MNWNFMKNFLILISVVFISLSCFSQKMDTLQFKSYYKISLSGKPQKVELIQFYDNNYKGYIITNLYYSKKKIRFTKNKTLRSVQNFFDDATSFLRKKDKEIVDTTYIANSLAEKLFIELKNNNIESIKDCMKEDNCIMFLDGDSTGFKIKTNDTYRKFWFEGLYPSGDESFLDIPENRVQAQKILRILDNELYFEKRFDETLKKLPKGSYKYYIGTTSISFNNK